MNHGDLIELPRVKTTQTTAILNSIFSNQICMNKSATAFLVYWVSWKFMNSLIFSTVSIITGSKIMNTLSFLNPILEIQVLFFGVSTYYLLSCAEKIHDIVYTLPIFTQTSSSNTSVLLNGLADIEKPYVQVRHEVKR